MSPALRMTLRNIERRPLRSALTTLGMAAALAIIVSGLFWRDALDYMIDVQFEAAQPADVLIALVEPQDARAGREVAALPGVLLTEGSRDVPVRLVAGHRYYRTVVQGLPTASELRRPLNADLARIPIPAEGLLLTDRLAARLGVAPGDAISVEVLEGDRRARDVPVVGIVHDLIGLSAYMNLGALNRLMGEGDTVSGVAAVLDGNSDGAGDAFFRRLKELPRVATVASKFAMMQNFRESTARNILFFTGVLTAFASVIAVGVVYNNARIALQERAWELASLRVLGFTRGEVSTFLLGELALELMAAIPLGCVMGYALSWVIVRMSHSDMIAIPVIVEPRTYAFATIAIVAAGCVSALIVRRRIDTLDLVAVLKTRE
jgi:putative ABC transport system permease protein